MRILITNDDGVHSDGILALKNALAPVGDVFVVAPERQRSAAGHAITLHKPLRVNRCRMSDGSDAWSSNGTPADCVTLGILEVMGGDCDVVLSGINHGPNLGWDVHYSGTVSAAFEAVMIGHRALAISVASYDREIHWTGPAKFAARLTHWLIENEMPPHVLLNVNFPNLPQVDIRGVAVTRQGPRQYVDRVMKRTDPAGRDYFWLGGTVAGHDALEGTDVRAIADNLVSVTPLQLDLTAHDLIVGLKEIERL